jgi:two-component system cell cycle sensor histidine kinase/response regulator CckA
VIVGGMAVTESFVTQGDAMPPYAALVVDDDSSVRNLIAAILEDEGFAVSCAGLGRDAVSLSASDRLDLVVVDFVLPDIDGLAVARSMKARHAAVRTLLTSGMPGAPGRAEDGVDAYLPKPFDLDTFIAILHRLCPPPAVEEPLGRPELVR